MARRMLIFAVIGPGAFLLIESEFATLNITVDGRFERPRTREVFAKENSAVEFFCGFSLLEKIYIYLHEIWVNYQVMFSFAM